MALADYINEAISMIAKSEVAKASSYDKTIICKVIKVYDERTNYYRVSNENINFDAKVLNGETYEKGDEVYVMVPQGDYNLEKLIIGKFSSSEKEKEVVELVGNKIIEVEKILLKSLDDEVEEVSLESSDDEVKKIVLESSFDRLNYNPNGEEYDENNPNPLLPTAWGVYLGFDTNLTGVNNIPDFEVIITLSNNASLTYNLKDTQGSILNLSPYIPIKVFNLEKDKDLSEVNKATIAIKINGKESEKFSWGEKNNSSHYIKLENVDLIFGYSIEPYEQENKILIQRADKAIDGLIMELTSATEDVKLDINMDLVSEQYYAGELVTWTRKENSNFLFKDAGDALTVSQKSPNITLIVPSGTNLNNGANDILTVSMTKNGKVYNGEARIWVSYSNDYNFQFDVIPNGEQTKDALKSKVTWGNYQTAYFGYSPNVLLQRGKPSDSNYQYSADIPGQPVLDSEIEVLQNNVNKGTISIGHKSFTGYSVMPNIWSYRGTEYKYKEVALSNTDFTCSWLKGTYLDNCTYNMPDANTYTGRYEGNTHRIELKENPQGGRNVFYQIQSEGREYTQYTYNRWYYDNESKTEVMLEYEAKSYRLITSQPPTYNWGTEGGFDYPVVAEIQNNILTIKTDRSLPPNKNITCEGAIKVEQNTTDYAMLLELNLDAKEIINNDNTITKYYELKNTFQHVTSLYYAYEYFPTCYKEYKGLKEDGSLWLDGKLTDKEEEEYLSNPYKVYNEYGGYGTVVKINNSDYRFKFNQEIKRLSSKKNVQAIDSNLEVEFFSNEYTLGTSDEDWSRKISFSWPKILKRPTQTGTITETAEKAYYNNPYFAQIMAWSAPSPAQARFMSIYPASTQALPMRIFYNHYQGTGKFGKYAPNKIQVPFTPQIIYFISNNQVYSWFNPQNSFNIKHVPNEAKFSNGEFIWYNNQNASAQLNSLGAQVNWIALG